MSKHINKIFSMIQTELKSEKVELALVDDYNKRIDKANEARKEASINLNRTEIKIGNAITQLELALKEGNKIEKASEDLGVKSPISISKVEAKLKQYRKVLSALKSLSIKN